MAPTLEGSDAALLPDFPRGPLHAYRARASFSWKELALFWDGADMLRFKVRPAAGQCWPCRFPVGSAGHLGLLARWSFVPSKPGGFPGPRLGLCEVWLALGPAQACLLFAPQDGRASGNCRGIQE